MSDFADRVVRLVAQPDYKPITLKAMARLLEVPADDYAEFRSSVKQLVKEGKIDLAKDKRLRRPDQAGLIVGVFRRSAKGFGFVRPPTSAEQTDQVFIPVEATRDASSGDEVAVKIVKRSRRDGFNIEGKIVQVLTRASGVFVGTYFEEGDTGFVQIDGTTFRDPVSVGDPGAKGVKPGDKVALEMVRYPTAYLERRRRLDRDPGPARAAGSRHLDGHSGVQYPRHVRGAGPRRGPRTGQVVQRNGDRRPARPERRPDRDDRPGDSA